MKKRYGWWWLVVLGLVLAISYPGTAQAAKRPITARQAKIAAGSSHSLVIQNDGSLWAWGANSAGQLGQGDNTNHSTPVRVGSDVNWTAITAASSCTLGIRADGTLWSWGDNHAGQLGLGDINSRLSPTQVGGAANWVAVAAGHNHTLGLQADGSLWAWGNNSFGQLGLGNYDAQLTPTRVGSDFNWVAIAAGDFFSLALRADGTLWAWGFNDNGQLGLGGITGPLTPTQVGTGTKWVSITAGYSHSAGLQADGTGWAWGANNHGQLSLGDTTPRDIPTHVSTLYNAAAVAGGDAFGLGLAANGTLWSTGFNASGQLGLGDTTDRLLITQVGTAVDWVAFAAGGAHSLALKADGTLYVFGNNISGQLGLGDTANRLVPTQVPGVNSGRVAAAAGSAHSLGIRADGSLNAWGDNFSGELGLGDTNARLSPTRVGSEANWIAVAAGTHSLGIRADGTLWAWGYNASGQLGLGDYPNRVTPIQVGTATNWVAVACGDQYSLGLRADGTLWAWGANVSGQLGLGNYTSTATPTQVGTYSDWMAVATGINHSLGLRADGTLWTWGYNASGQLGQGDTTNRTTPTQVVGYTDWTTVAAGDSHSLGLRANGSLRAWGNNVSGQLGLGDNVTRLSPNQVGSLVDWKGIAARGSTSLGVRPNGNLWAWGFNASGQLGLGDFADRNVPNRVGSLSIWTVAAPGWDHTLAIQGNSSDRMAGASGESSAAATGPGSGTLWAWGSNGHGELGQGNTTASSTPVQVPGFPTAPLTHTITATATAGSGAGGTISPTGAVPVAEGGTQTFVFSPDAYSRVFDVVVDGVSQGALSNYTFTNVTANHTISVHFILAGNFIISTDAGPGGTISPSGTVEAFWGENKTFNFTPNAGYHIEDVIVDDISQGPIASYTFTYVTSDHSIGVFFALDPVINATATGNGTLSPSGAVSVPYGSDQTFTITPAAGHYVASVLVDGNDQGHISSYTFFGVTANRTLAVTFAPNPVINATATGNGTLSPSGAVSVPYGSDQTFTITPAAGHYVASVLVDGNDQGHISSYTFFGVTANHTLAVTFAPNPVITATATGNGTLSPSGAVSVPYGSDQTFTITPAAGHYVASVLVDGNDHGHISSYTFFGVTANRTLAVTFASNPVIAASAGPNGTISPSGNVEVTYSGSRAFTMTPTANYHVADVLVDGVSVGAVTAYTFTNVVANHTISVTFAADTHTITASAGANGSISPSGAVTVAHAANQTFTITPAANYHVADVLVDGSSVGAVTSYTFTNVTANHTIAATFAINTHTITASAGSNGSIAPSGAVTVAHAANQSFTITPAANYHVANVLVDGLSVGAVTGYTFTNVVANHTISVTFAADTHTITASAGANGTIAPSGVVTVNHGANQTFNFTPAANYHVAGVVVDGTPVTGAPSSYTFTNVTANHTIAVTFAINTHTITASAGANGAIAPSGTVTVNHGANQTFNFTPAANYHVASVVVDGTPVTGAPSSYTFTNVTANHTIAVTFAINTHTITASAGANGAIAPSGTVTVNHGANQTFNFTPAANYHVAGVVVDGTPVTGAPASYTFTNVIANHTIAVSFAINTHTITASAGANGAIAPSGTVTVNHGANQTFNFTPAANYHVASVVVDGTPVTGAPASYTFTNVIANHTIAVTFAINTHTITASAGANGAIAPSGTVTVNHGANQTFNFTPAANYHVASVVVDGTPVTGAPASYTFTNVIANHTIAVSFSINTHTITASAGANGAIAPSGAVTVNHGANQTFNFTPAANYHVAGVVVDGTPVTGAPASYTFTNVTANHTIAVTFAINSFTITASAGAGGSISPSGAITVNYGANSPIFLIVPNTNYHIQDVKVDGVSQGAISSFTFTNVTAAHTITASFVPYPAVVTDKARVQICEGDDATFQVKLDRNPGANVTVSIAKESGIAEIACQSGPMTFNSGNWNQYQTVYLVATYGSKNLSGTAVFRLTGTGLISTKVTAVKTGRDLSPVYQILLKD